MLTLYNTIPGEDGVLAVVIQHDRDKSYNAYLTSTSFCNMIGNSYKTKLLEDAIRFADDLALIHKKLA
jgi:hypothetical protein